MLLERSHFITGLIVGLIVVIGTVFAVGLTGGVFVPGMRLEAEFADAAGIEQGDFVFLAGVRVGQVTDVRIDQGIVVTEFAVESDGVPEDSTVSIILQSTLGKRALRLDPGSSSASMEEGDRIVLARTSTPVDLPELGDRSAELLGEVDIDALQALTTALADITEGQRGDVILLLDGVQQVSDILVRRRGDLERVLDRAQSVIDTAADKDQEIVQIVDSFSIVLDTLLRRQNEIKTLLVNTADTADLTADLLEERRGQLDQVLAELHLDLEVVEAHQVDLAHIFAYGGVAFEGFAAIGYGFGEEKIDTPTWGNVFARNVGAVGIDALLSCGGTLDQVFTGLVGPDPRCEQQARTSSEPSPAQPDPATGSLLPVPTELPSADGDLATFFDVSQLLQLSQLTDALESVPPASLGGVPEVSP